MSDATATLPPPTSTMPDLLYVRPAVPPGVSPDIAYLIESQAIQHFERRQDTRALTNALVTGAAKTNEKIDKIEVDLASKPGKAQVNAIMLFAAGVFLLMLFAAFQKNGIDSNQAVQNTQAILSATTKGGVPGSAPGHSSDSPPAVVPAPAQRDPAPLLP